MRIEDHKGFGSHSKKDARPVSGRKPTQESRATEFHQKLSEWRQMPVSSRPSLRALARKLSTSHQLLGHFLKGWDKWQSKEYWRQAMEIRARAIAEGRLLTQREEQQVNAYTGAAIRTIVLPALLDNIEQIEQDAKRGPLNRYQIRMLKILAREFPEARELLQKCSQSSVKNQKNNLPPSSSGAAKSFRRE